MSLNVETYLQWARGSNVPPLCLELVLRSGRSYWIKSIFDPFDADGLFAIRVWDFRALGEAEMAELTSQINRIRDRSEYGAPEKIHPLLNQANLWIRIADIEHIVEWHDRFWPEPTREIETRNEIGFVTHSRASRSDKP